MTYWRFSWNYCPEEEGIKTMKTLPYLSANIVGTTALKKKGLRPVGPSAIFAIIVGTTALKKKGLRRDFDVRGKLVGGLELLP